MWFPAAGKELLVRGPNDISALAGREAWRERLIEKTPLLANRGRASECPEVPQKIAVYHKNTPPAQFSLGPGPPFQDVPGPRFAAKWNKALNCPAPHQPNASHFHQSRQISAYLRPLPCVLCHCAIVPYIASCGPSDRVLKSVFFSPSDGDSGWRQRAGESEPNPSALDGRLSFGCCHFSLLLLTFPSRLFSPSLPREPFYTGPATRHEFQASDRVENSNWFTPQSVSGAGTCLAMRASTDLELRSCLMLQGTSWKPTSSQQTRVDVRWCVFTHLQNLHADGCGNWATPQSYRTFPQ